MNQSTSSQTYDLGVYSELGTTYSRIIKIRPQAIHHPFIIVALRYQTTKSFCVKISLHMYNVSLVFRNFLYTF